MSGGATGDSSLGAAFFQFGTNINDTVAEVEAGLQRMNAALASRANNSGVDPLPRSAVNNALAGFDQAFAKVKELNALFGRGGIDKDAYAKQYRDAVRGAMSSLQSELSASGSKLNLSPIQRAGWSEYAQDAAKGYAQAFKRALPAELSDVAYSPRQIGRFVKQAGNLDYTSTATSRSNAAQAAEMAAMQAEAIKMNKVFDDQRAATERAAKSWQSLGNMVAQARKMMDAEFTGRGNAIMKALADEESAAERDARAWQDLGRIQQQARKMMDADFTGRGNAVMKALDDEAAALQRLGATQARAITMNEKFNASQAQLAQRARVQSLEQQVADNPLATFIQKLQGGKTASGGVVNGLVNHAASAVAFTAAYGGIFAVQAALRDTVAEFLDYQDSVTDAEVAMQSADGVTQSWVNSLSDLSRLAGENVGASLDSAARGIRAFQDNVQGEGKDGALTDEQKRDIGTQTTDASTKLALISGQDQKTATGNVVAIGTAYNLLPSQLSQVVDAVAAAKRDVGGDAADIATGLSTLALTAQQAGYSLSQTADIIGLVQSRTDQSGETVATQLARIFQITAGSSGTGLAAQLSSLDPTGKLANSQSSVADKLQAFAGIYASTSDQGIKDQISTTLGGTNNLKALLPLLRDNVQLQDAFRNSLTHSGQGVSEVDRMTGNLIGTLNKLKSDVKDIQVNAAISGIAAPAGELVKALEPALYAVNEMLSVWNQMPAPIRDVVGAVIDIGVALKVLGSLEAAKGLVGALRTARAGGVAGGAAGAAAGAGEAAAASSVVAANEAAAAAQARYTAALTSQTATAAEVTAANEALVAATTAAAEAEAAQAATAGKTGWFAGTRAGASLVGSALTNPAVIAGLAATEALILVGKGIQDSHDRSAMEHTSTSSLDVYTKLGDSSQSLSQASQSLAGAADDIKQGKNGGAPGEQKMFTDAANARAGGLAEADANVKAINDMAAAQHKLASEHGAVTTLQGLADVMNSMSRSGGAVKQAKELTKFLNTDPSKQAAWDEGTVYKSLIGAIGASTADGVKGVQVRKAGGAGSRTGVINYSDAELQSMDVVDKATSDRIRDALDAQIKKQGLDPKIALTEAQKKALLQAAMKQVDLSAFGDQANKVIAQQLPAALAKLTLPDPSSTKDAINGHSPLNYEQIMGTPADETTGAPAQPGRLQVLQDRYAAIQQLIPSSDDGSKLRDTQQQYIKWLQNLSSRSVDDIPELATALQNAQHEYTSSLITQAEAVRKAAEDHAMTKSAVQAVRIQNVIGEFDTILKNNAGDAALIDQLLGELDVKTINAVRAHAEEAVQIARDAYQRTVQLAQAAEASLQGTGVLIGALANTALGAALNPELGKLDDASGAQKKAKAGLDAAVKQLKAIDEGIKTTAPTSLTAPLGDLAKDAQQTAQDLAQVKLAYDSAMRQLAGDFTNPVENARDALADAKEKLAVDSKTPGVKRDVLAQDKLGVEQSEAALQKARWDQKLSDMQTAEQLGRIGYGTYMNYLQHESTRMHNMAHKSRQQIDYMNQVDQALQAANDSLSAQFNLGGVNTAGLVYEARRYGRQILTQQIGNANHGMPIGSNAATHNNNITINGADYATIKKVLGELLGQGTVTKTAKPRKPGA